MAYVSARDLNDLLERCIETDDIPYAVVAGISNNTRKRFDLVHTRRLLGYAPRDDGFKVLGIDGGVGGLSLEVPGNSGEGRCAQPHSSHVDSEKARHP
jgi:hypothetical protein